MSAASRLKAPARRFVQETQILPETAPRLADLDASHERCFVGCDLRRA
jgi:hypothetical protein